MHEHSHLFTNLLLFTYKGEAEQRHKQRWRPKKQQKKHEGQQKKNSKRKRSQQQWQQRKQYSHHTQELTEEQPWRWQQVLQQVIKAVTLLFLFHSFSPLTHSFVPFLQLSLKRIVGVLLLLFLIYYISSSFQATPTIQSHVCSVGNVTQGSKYIIAKGY